VDLSAAGGIESGTVENERRTWVLEGLADFGVEGVEKRVVIVEAVGHAKSILRVGSVGMEPHRGSSASE
jgi:hypothetical protein